MYRTNDIRDDILRAMDKKSVHSHISKLLNHEVWWVTGRKVYDAVEFNVRNPIDADIRQAITNIMCRYE